MIKDIATLYHPVYELDQHNWMKWRLTYEGGDHFIHQYLEKYSAREDDKEFSIRRAYSYNPAFAAGAVNDVKNSIYSRMADIERSGGSISYQHAVKGLNGGVDNNGSSMNVFLGQKILPELLTMRKVGVYVDMPVYNGTTLADTYNKRPYLYYYRAEDIRSWVFNRNGELISVLLREEIEEIDDVTGLPNGKIDRYRRMWIGKDGYVRVQFYDEGGQEVDYFNNVSVQGYGVDVVNPSTEIKLQIRKIPLIISEITKSLLQDISNYQIALLNLASGNLSYALKSNYPFYTEQFDPRADNPFTRPIGYEDKVEEDGTALVASKSGNREVETGVSKGRRYPLGVERPGFINPSSEPLKVSMELQLQMKEELRQLLALTLSTLNPKFASAESKDRDQRGLESGLSYIGLELETLERKITELWSMYENNKPATINYPKNYTLKTDAERRQEAKELDALKTTVPSIKGRKEIAKRIASTLLDDKVPFDEMQKIHSEIDNAKYLESDPVAIEKDVKNGLVSTETASTARGYDGEKEVVIAKEQHAERLALIAKSQSDGFGQDNKNGRPLKEPVDRGVSDLGG